MLRSGGIDPLPYRFAPRGMSDIFYLILTPLTPITNPIFTHSFYHSPSSRSSRSYNLPIIPLLIIHPCIITEKSIYQHRNSQKSSQKLLLIITPFKSSLYTSNLSSCYSNTILIISYHHSWLFWQLSARMVNLAI